MDSVTFKIPTPSAFCCQTCNRNRRNVMKDNSYPVVKIEDAPEISGGKRVYIKMDCGKIDAYSILYFM